MLRKKVQTHTAAAAEVIVLQMRDAHRWQDAPQGPVTEPYALSCRWLSVPTTVAPRWPSTSELILKVAADVFGSSRLELNVLTGCRLLFTGSRSKQCCRSFTQVWLRARYPEDAGPSSCCDRGHTVSKNRQKWWQPPPPHKKAQLKEN